MKIHVVQKGDTLWNIAKKYGVDFEQVKQMNTQLSDPDMIMPGMKIKIPSTTKQVKKEIPMQKEMEKYPAKHPYKEIPSKPMPVMKEDGKEQPSKEIPMQPIMPQMPVMEQQTENYYTTVNIPNMPSYHQPKTEYPEHEHKDYNDHKDHQEKTEEEFQNFIPAHPPMVPIYCYPVMPCCAPNPTPCHHPCHHPGHHQGYPIAGDCGYQGMHYGHNWNPYPQQQAYHHSNEYNMHYGNNCMEPSAEMDMSKMPHHLAGMKDDCSCHQEDSSKYGYFGLDHTGHSYHQPPYGGYGGYGESFMHRPAYEEELEYNGESFDPVSYEPPQQRQPQDMPYPPYFHEEDEDENE